MMFFREGSHRRRHQAPGSNVGEVCTGKGVGGGSGGSKGCNSGGGGGSGHSPAPTGGARLAFSTSTSTIWQGLPRWGAGWCETSEMGKGSFPAVAVLKLAQTLNGEGVFGGQCRSRWGERT